MAFSARHAVSIAPVVTFAAMSVTNAIGMAVAGSGVWPTGIAGLFFYLTVLASALGHIAVTITLSVSVWVTLRVVMNAANVSWLDVLATMGLAQVPLMTWAVGVTFWIFGGGADGVKLAASAQSLLDYKRAAYAAAILCAVALVRVTHGVGLLGAIIAVLLPVSLGYLILVLVAHLLA